MKVKVIEEKRPIMGVLYSGDLLKDKVYNAEIDKESNNWFRIIDESGEDYLYPPQLFEIVEG